MFSDAIESMNGSWIGCEYSTMQMPFMKLVFANLRSVVLKLGSIEPQGFGESDSGVRWFGLVG